MIWAECGWSSGTRWWLKIVSLVRLDSNLCPRAHQASSLTTRPLTPHLRNHNGHYSMEIVILTTEIDSHFTVNNCLKSVTSICHRELEGFTTYLKLLSLKSSMKRQEKYFKMESLRAIILRIFIKVKLSVLSILSLKFHVFAPANC